MQLPRTKIIDRLKKMMRLAEDQAGKPEGLLAAQKAHALMRQHAIEMVDLRGEEKEDIETLELEIGHRMWKRTLLNILASHCNCQMYYLVGKPIGCIVGFEAEATVAKYLYEVTCREIERHATAFVKRKKHLSRGEKRQLGTDFKTTAVEGVRATVKSIQAQSEQTHATGTALMVNRKKDVDQWVDSNLNLVSKRSYSRNEYSEAGFQCGKNISLSKGLSASNSDELTGG